MTRFRVLIVMALVIAASACQKKDREGSDHAADSLRVDARPGMLAVPGDTIARGPWRWVFTVTPAERIVCPIPERYALEFLPDSTVRVILDCNRGSGPYHADGKTLRIGPIATTRMMCPEGTIDTVFAKELDAARGWFMQGDTLMLDLFADSGTMRFVR
jgi:heat shock protein HslJ